MKFIFSLILLSLLINLSGCLNHSTSNNNDQNKSNESIVNTNNTNIIKSDSSKDIKISLEELLQLFDQKNDSIYVYNFWATWCKPCIAELPYFEKLGQEYADKKVKVTLISLDFPEQLETGVLPFIKKKQLKSQVYLLEAGNPNEWIDTISTDWTGSIPATLILAPNQNIRQFYEQEFTYDELLQEILPLLQQASK